ncbi:hypothetical protein [Nocardiopsis composta]|uniref:DUF2867 domain-containing protein n=1 Tax=Nocardiopsis composta TaxID=157465 RepID=A0A7W8QJ38_9ACTN|nr:hypothetical protein [Nocardiopsis composta]MBB5431417.1 hypothetical protein [Nocardiopsis composta]
MDPEPDARRTASATEPQVTGGREVPEEIRALSTVTDPDYADFFVLMAGGAAHGTPEEWTRAAFEETFASPGARFLLGRVLGLSLQPPGAPGCVGGWRIAGRGDGWLRIEAEGRSMSVHIVVRTEEDRVSAATIIGYRRWWAARVWPPLSARHRGFMPGLLRKAHARLVHPAG